MAQDIVSGLFGLSPADVERQQYDKSLEQSLLLAKMQPMERAAYGAAQAGSGIADAGLGMMGIPNRQVEEAKMTEAAMSGLDTNDPAAIFARAQQIQDPRLKMKLTMLAQQRSSEIQKMQMEANKQELAERKQSFNEDEAFALRKLEATARIRQNDERIADARTNNEERIQLMRESNQIRAALGMAMRDKNTEKPLTPAQKMKLNKEMSAAGSALRTVKDTYFDIENKAEALKAHPGLAGSTGVRGMLPSLPGSQSGKADTLLKEFQSAVQKIGLEIVRAGGSIGQMTEREWKIVEGMVSNIDPVKLGKDGTIDQINKAVAIAQGMMNNAISTYDERYGEYTPDAPKQPNVAPSKPQAIGAPPAGAVRIKGAK
jgi:hypothetical protein